MQDLNTVQRLCSSHLSELSEAGKIMGSRRSIGRILRACLFLSLSRTVFATTIDQW